VSNFWAGGFAAATADGAVRTTNKNVSEKTLRTLVTPSGGEVLAEEWWWQ